MFDNTENDRQVSSNFEVNRKGSGFQITSPFVSIDAQKDPFLLELTIQKQPTSVELGTVLESITIDDESPQLKCMLEEARSLTDLPEKQRIQPLLSIVRKNIQYAYPKTIEQLAKDNPELATLIDEKTGLKSEPSTPLTLSEIIDLGYGICRHLSVVMLVLAKEAGLRGTLLSYQYNPEDLTATIINVIRKDTGEPLFQSVGVGQPFTHGHTYLELLTSEGEWIPIDPSTKLLGDSEEGMVTFREANYQANVSTNLKTIGLPDGVYAVPDSNLQFRAGENQRTGNFRIGGYTQTLLGRGQPTVRYCKYDGPLDFQLSTVISYTGTVIEIKNVTPA